MYIIVGLGNPEEKYAKTFHNMGFNAAADAAAILGAKFKKKECSSYVAEAYVNGDKAREVVLRLGGLTDDEREIILKGCLINYYRG